MPQQTQRELGARGPGAEALKGELATPCLPAIWLMVFLIVPPTNLVMNGGWFLALLYLAPGLSQPSPREVNPSHGHTHSAWSRPTSTVHFNMLNLHKTLRTLSQCHHFGDKNCTCQMKNTMGTPQNMVSVSLQAETPDCWQRLNGSRARPARPCASPARRPATHHHHLHLYHCQQQ